MPRPLVGVSQVIWNFAWQIGILPDNWQALRIELGDFKEGTAMNTHTEADLRWAVDRLSKTDPGRNALRHLLTWLDEDGVGLDQVSQEAVYMLLAGVWGRPRARAAI